MCRTAGRRSSLRSFGQGVRHRNDLPQLIDAIHEVKSGSIRPYLDHNHETICKSCVLLNTEVCPCPLHYLAVLTVEAVETVDERHRLNRLAMTAKATEEPVGC